MRLRTLRFTSAGLCVLLSIVAGTSPSLAISASKNRRGSNGSYLPVTITERFWSSSSVRASGPASLNDRLSPDRTVLRNNEWSPEVHGQTNTSTAS